MTARERPRTTHGEERGRRQVFEDAGDRAAERGRELPLGVGRAERVRAVLPAREMEVPTRSLLAGNGLGEEARDESHRSGNRLHRELHENGVVGGAQAVAGREVELEEPRAGLGVDAGELDAERRERRLEGGDGGREGAELGERWAGDAREPARTA